MSYKFFRLFFVLILVIGSVAIPAPQSVRAAGPWYVSTTGDDNNDCLSSSSACATINGAIGKASAGDTINVAVGTYTGTGGTEVVLIDRNITLSGGWDTTFSMQSGMSTINGEGLRRGISLIDSNVTSIVERVMVQNGNYSWGGGIANYGNLTLNNSTISGNTSSFIEGGGIANYGTFTLNNSTIRGNKGGGWGGGGIYTITGGNVTINNSTIIDNSGIFGGGIYIVGGTLTLTNTILSNNTSTYPSNGPNCYSVFATLTSSGHNIIRDTSGCDITATTGDQFDIDPQLSVFLPTQGYSALLPTSPAIDAGNLTTCLSADQRGVARVGTCDIGAYEYTTPGTAISITAVSGNSQITGTNSAFSLPFQAAALDSQGSPVSGVSIEFTAPASGPSGTFADTGTNITSVSTNEGGVATTQIFSANNQAGGYTVSGSAGNLGVVNFNLEQVTRPVHDNFANAKAILSLPFSDSFDTTNATAETGEQNCYSPAKNTVWYIFTPAVNGPVKVDLVGTRVNDAVLTIWQDTGAGLGGLSNPRCGYSTFIAQVGVTYYIQAGSIGGIGGELGLNLQEIPAPSNDNFASATLIGTLPFSDIVDNSGATVEPNEPQNCNPPPTSIWYSFTPTDNALMSADMAGSSFGDTSFSVYQDGGSGIGGLNFIQCADFGSIAKFNVQAGTTYYIQAGSIYSGGGSLHLNLQEIPRPENDNFSGATVIPSSLPYSDTVDTTSATIQTNEPTPSCAFYGLNNRSVWYSFTPATSGTFSANVPYISFAPVYAVYTGSSIDTLTQISCNYAGNNLTFQAEAGTTYYFQVANLYPWEQGGTMQFHLDVAPPPVAGIYFSPSDPTIFDNIQFYDQSYDPSGLGIQSFAWDFGDGTTSTDAYPTHRYAKEGDYTVQHTVTTIDGRTASTSQTVHVSTHDVTVTKVESPGSARTGQTQDVTVAVNNATSISETVRVDLYRSVIGGGFEWVNSLTLTVPPSKNNRSTQFLFRYTFTAADAQIGKVIFQAVATIEGVRDAFPQDNERYSSLTMVKQKK